MSKQLKKLTAKAVALGTLTMASASSFAAGVGDIASGIDLSSGKEAVIATGVALGGFLVIGLAVRYVLGFFKRV